MNEPLDLAIIGAGPCGISVGASAAQAGKRTVLFDKGCVTASLIGYPYYMTFFSTAKKLEIAGVPFTIVNDKPSRREALAYYRRVVEHYDMEVRQYEEVLDISGAEGDFVLRTQKRDMTESTIHARTIVMATGGFHEPNRLGVPGEDLGKALHYYQEPYPFYDQDVVIVGAGNSAVECALEIYRSGGRVTLVHFDEKIDRGVKPWVVPDIENRLERGEIPVFWKHRIAEITPSTVILRSEETGETTEIKNDWVLAMTGWRANPVALRALGVEFDEETGIPHHDRETMETNVPGVFIAGVLAAGHNANKIFIENGKLHGPKILAALAAG